MLSATGALALFYVDFY